MKPSKSTILFAFCCRLSLALSVEQSSLHIDPGFLLNPVIWAHMAGITTDRDIPQEPGPLAHQFLEKRGKTPSPPLKNRVMVADPNQRTVEVQSKKSVTNGE